MREPGTRTEADRSTIWSIKRCRVIPRRTARANQRLRMLFRRHARTRFAMKTGVQQMNNARRPQQWRPERKRVRRIKKAFLRYNEEKNAFAAARR